MSTEKSKLQLSKEEKPDWWLVALLMGNAFLAGMIASMLYIAWVMSK